MLRRIFKRHMLIVGFVAVLVPLGVLLALQYRWLVRLQETSAIAETAYLNNYLEAVSSEVEYFYRKQAERSLNIPQYYFSQKDLEKIGAYFRKKAAEGTKYLFAVKYVAKQEWGETLGYNPVEGRFGPPPDPGMFHAISVSLSPWKTLAFKGSAVPSHEMVVNQMDPRNIVIVNPITDDACQLLGIAGMIVDTGYFENEVLTRAINKSLPKFFDERAMENLVVSVRDGMDRTVWGSDFDGEEGSRIDGAIPFIFSNWRISLGTRFTTPEQIAQSNFMLNITLSALVAVALLAGIVLALRTADRQVKLSQMKSDFVSNVSHELRTPLASIRVFGEFLRLGRVEDRTKTREYGEFIETESRRLTQLIDNILDFSKIESGAKTYEFETVAIDEVVAGTVHQLQLSLRHKGFHLTYAPCPAPLPEITIDPDAVAQALANLVDNAVKYSNGAKEVRVALRREDSAVVVSVTDEGIGISRAEQKKIFERFHRVGTSLVHDVKGSGLGLSIVNHIIQAHGGRVTVESALGRGSTFAIHLPLPQHGEKHAGTAPPSIDPAQRVEES